MSYRRHNVSVVTGNFTGLTTGATITGSSLFVGESEKKVMDVSAHLILTCTMTSATYKVKWQGSSDGSTYAELANDAAGTAAVAVLTGATGSTVTIGAPAPASAYSYKYMRPIVLFTSSTAGTTNDAVSIGLSYRQLEAGAGL